MVREAGGLNIADEVQTGFGRTGTHYWGFQNQVRMCIRSRQNASQWNLDLGIGSNAFR